VVPLSNAAEAALVPAMRVISAEVLVSLIDWLRFGELEVSGPGCRCWSLVPGAAGGHQMLLLGPPGSGNRMPETTLSGTIGRN
jgi:predicted ATPase with chaperone activity